jgi:FKBP-type peptidyl-prolyl cis-trans isomerase FkpA
MELSLRNTAAGLCAAALSLTLAACKPLDKETGKPAGQAEGATESSAPLGGMKTEKEQVSYVIGTDIGKSLEPAKDELDLAVLTRAIRDAMDGKKPKLTEAETRQVMQAFGMRMQAKQLAELEEQKQKNLAEGEAFLAGNGKKDGVVTTESGLQYQVLAEGTGARPKATDTVRVHYKGELLNGEEFDSSYERGEPAQFVLNQVVPGWQEALQLMPVGSKYKLWIPGALGYGEMGTPGGPIGPNATLVFEVELLDIVKQGQ